MMRFAQQQVAAQGSVLRRCLADSILPASTQPTRLWSDATASSNPEKMQPTHTQKDDVTMDSFTSEPDKKPDVEQGGQPSMGDTIHLHLKGPDTRRETPPPGSPGAPHVLNATQEDMSHGLMEAAGINPAGGGTRGEGQPPGKETLGQKGSTATFAQEAQSSAAGAPGTSPGIGAASPGLRDTDSTPGVAKPGPPSGAAGSQFQQTRNMGWTSIAGAWDRFIHAGRAAFGSDDMLPPSLKPTDKEAGESEADFARRTAEQGADFSAAAEVKGAGGPAGVAKSGSGAPSDTTNVKIADHVVNAPYPGQKEAPDPRPRKIADPTGKSAALEVEQGGYGELGHEGAGKDPSIAAAQGAQPSRDPHFEGESAFSPGGRAGNKQRSWDETGAN